MRKPAVAAKRRTAPRAFEPKILRAGWKPARVSHHSYFGQWFPGYDPKLHDSITGPVEGAVLRLARSHRLSVYNASYLELASERRYHSRPWTANLRPPLARKGPVPYDYGVKVQ